MILNRRRHGALAPAQRGRGFTLVELLVVLVVIATLSGFALLALRGRDVESVVEEEARRLLALFTLAREESLFRYRTIGVRFFRGGYDFAEFLPGDERWMPALDAMLTGRRFPEGVTVRLYLEGRPVILDVEEDEGTDEEVLPQVVLFPDGTGTDFELALEASGFLSPVLRGTAGGRIELDGTDDRP